MDFGIVFVVPEGRGVATGGGGFFAHGFGGFFEREEDDAFGFLVVDVAHQGGNVAAFDAAALDLDDDFLALLLGLVNVEQP